MNLKKKHTVDAQEQVEANKMKFKGEK